MNAAEKWPAVRYAGVYNSYAGRKRPAIGYTDVIPRVKTNDRSGGRNVPVPEQKKRPAIRYTGTYVKNWKMREVRDRYVLASSNITNLAGVSGGGM